MCRGKKRLALVCETHPSRAADKERKSHLGFELLDLARQPWLIDVEPPRGFAERHFLGDNREADQPIEIGHPFTSPHVTPLSGPLFVTTLHKTLCRFNREAPPMRSEEHTSELQSLMRISYAVFCLKKQ